MIYNNPVIKKSAVSTNFSRALIFKLNVSDVSKRKAWARVHLLNRFNKLDKAAAAGKKNFRKTRFSYHSSQLISSRRCSFTVIQEVEKGSNNSPRDSFLRPFQRIWRGKGQFAERRVKWRAVVIETLCLTWMFYLPVR